MSEPQDPVPGFEPPDPHSDGAPAAPYGYGPPSYHPSLGITAPDDTTWALLADAVIPTWLRWPMVK